MIRSLEQADDRITELGHDKGLGGLLGFVDWKLRNGKLTSSVVKLYFFGWFFSQKKLKPKSLNFFN